MDGQPETKTFNLFGHLRASKLAAMLNDWQAKGVKRSKFQAFYRQQPRVSSASCEKCMHFIPGPNGMSSCRLVACKDAPDQGFISPTASCSLWNAGPARIVLEDKLRGRGEGVAGAAPGNLRVRAEQLLSKGEATAPPEEVQERMFMKGKPLSVIKDAAASVPRVFEATEQPHEEQIQPEAAPQPPERRPPSSKHDKTALLRMV